MMYPLNLFTPAPTGGMRPFIMFVALEPKFNLGKAKSWDDALPVRVPVGGFALPFPNGGLSDTVQHNYDGTGSPIQSKALSLIPGTQDTLTSDLTAHTTGMVLDPLMTNIYKGTQARKWSGTWQIVPQSLMEGLAVALLLAKFKKWASPDRRSVGKVGMLVQPHNWKIIFGNPAIQLAMNFNDMALEGYSINYFAQGYASTYKDMLPKHIEFTLNFAEFGIKYRSDW